MFARFRLAAFAAAALAMAASTASPTLAQGEVVNAPDPYLHKSVGVAFPEQAGEFERSRVTEFNAEGSDLGVGYFRSDQPGQITLYLYPVRDASCDAEFAGTIAAIEGHPGAKKLQAPALRLGQFPGARQQSARYSIPANAYGYEHPELVSDAWLGCLPGGKWLIKYRGSFYASDAKAVEGVAERMFAAIDWSPVTGQ